MDDDGASISPERDPPTVLFLLRKLQSLGFCSHIDPFAGETSADTGDSLSLFDRILKTFMKDVDRGETLLPLPALIGDDGQLVDLFRLYKEVADKGGFASVASAGGSWNSVAEAVGLDARLGSPLKVIHFKYLCGLNPTLSRVLEEELSGLKGEFLEPVQEDAIGPQEECGMSGSDDLVIWDNVTAWRALYSGQRKLKPLSKMLNWVLTVAKNPTNSSVGLELEEGEDPEVGVLMSQACAAQKIRLVKRGSQSNYSDSPLQKRRKFHPPICEDDSGLDSTKDQKLRCSESNKNLEAGGGNHDKRRSARKARSVPDRSVALFAKKNPRQKRTPVGSSFQVEVPEWTGNPPGDSDEKWLRAPLWPLEGNCLRAVIEGACIGKGREDKCACGCPGSEECIKHHVEERRLQLKNELGSAFIDLGFNLMGEEASSSWTEREERMFKAIVRLNPQHLSKNFWDSLQLSFPSKGRKSLVNYYFNVFLLRRRRYQNRVNPSSVDSDNDETDDGFLSRPFSRSC